MENETLVEVMDELISLELIDKKCREHCGMKRAWPDGLCHATADMCCLAPHSPIWAGREILVAPVATPDWGDL